MDESMTILEEFHEYGEIHDEKDISEEKNERLLNLLNRIKPNEMILNNEFTNFPPCKLDFSTIKCVSRPIYIDFDEDEIKALNEFSLTTTGVVYEEKNSIKYVDFKSKGNKILFKNQGTNCLFKFKNEIFLQLSKDHTILLFDLKTKKNLLETKECFIIQDVKFNSDFIIYISNSLLESFTIINRKTNEKSILFGRKSIEKFQFSGNELFLLNDNGIILEYEINTRKHIGSFIDFQVRDSYIEQFVFDDSYLVSSGESHIFIWNRRNKKVKSRIKFSNHISSIDLNCSYLAVVFSKISLSFEFLVQQVKKYMHLNLINQLFVD